MKTVNESSVTYKYHSGSDLSIVNAARVSFDKESQWEIEDTSQDDCECFSCKRTVLSKQDQRLINYLAKHNHWTPFAHTSITLKIDAPLSVARQLGKHQVGLVWNEVSRRYVDSEPEFFIPMSWRKRPDASIKQGSGEEFVEEKEYFVELATGISSLSLAVYNKLLECNVAPEIARFFLPQNMMVSFYWTGSLSAFVRVVNLRLDPHTQKETRDVAQQILDVIQPLFPYSVKALVKTSNEQ